MTRLRLAVFGLVVLPLASCSSCRKGGAATDAGPDPGVAVAPDATADAEPPAPVVSAAPETSAEPAGTGAKTVTAAAGGPFQGTYGCLGSLTLTQNGNAVSGSGKPFGSQQDFFRCTVSGDICTGTATRTTHTKGKPDKTEKLKDFTFKRDPNGTLHYSAPGNAPENCFKK